MSLWQGFLAFWLFFAAPLLIIGPWLGPIVVERIKQRHQNKVGFTDPAAKVIVRLLKTEPGAWSMPDPYYIKHDSGIYIKHPDCVPLMSWFVPGLGSSREVREDDYNKREIRKAISFWKNYTAEEAFRNLKVTP